MKKLLYVFLCICQPAAAIEVENLYETEVIAQSSSSADRNQAIRKALQRVLNRIVIERDLKKPLLQTVLDGAPHYVQEFQFSLATPSALPAAHKRLLRVKFDEDMLLSVFKNSTIGLWNEIRPETLLWLVVEQQGQRRFYQPEPMPGIEFSLMRAAQQKKLPLIFPLLDMEEQRFITTNDVLSADPKLLLDVSSRYDVVSVMAGRLTQSGSCWQAEWALYFNQKIHQWRTEHCQPLDQAALSGMKGLYAVLSNYYGIQTQLTNNQ